MKSLSIHSRKGFRIKWPSLLKAAADIREYGDADRKLRQKLEKQGKFDASFKEKLKIENVNMDVMGRWVGERLTEDGVWVQAEWLTRRAVLVGQKVG